MKLIGVALYAAAISTAGVLGIAAQDTKTKTQTKISVEDGKDVKVTGCVTASSRGTGYVLTNVADKHGVMHDYILVTDENLAKHVGQRLQIEGKVTDRGDGKVKIETNKKTEIEDAPDQEQHAKAVLEGVAPYLGVKSMKVIAAACP